MDQLKEYGLNMLKLLKIHPNVIYDYEMQNKINRSENKGILFWLSAEEREMVNNFEKNHTNCKVYHIIKSISLDFGKIYDLLYVVDDEDFMKQAKEDLKDNLVLAYTISPFSESGLISVKCINGGISRNY